MDWFDEKLIQKVQEHDELYDNKKPQFRRRGSKQYAWLSIADELNSTEDYCMSRWKDLRARYCEELRKMECNYETPVVSNWRFFKDMDFLRPFIRPLRSRRFAVRRRIAEEGPRASTSDDGENSSGRDVPSVASSASTSDDGDEEENRPDREGPVASTSHDYYDGAGCSTNEQRVCLSIKNSEDFGKFVSQLHGALNPEQQKKFKSIITDAFNNISANLI